MIKSSDYWLSWSGAGFGYASALYMVLNVWQCLNPPEEECTDRVLIPRDKSHLYRVGLNYYVGSYIKALKDLSGGLLEVEPKDCDTGLPLSSLGAAIVYREDNGEPLSEWEGFLDYMASRPDTDGDTIPNMPSRYAGIEGRMIDRCFIATAAYGSPFEAKVGLLRQFRDNILQKSSLGKRFIELYYVHSPSLADTIAQSDWLKAMVRLLLLPVVGVAKLMLWVF
jgi:hypothetical protein